MGAFPEPLSTGVVLALGLTVGSFLNVCIHRLPRGESVVRPRSRCPSCRRPLPWYENVPVVSWIALRGRCAGCAAPISWRYPLVESLGAVIAVASWKAFGPSAAFLIVVPYGWALTVLFFTDLDLQVLPDAVTLPGAAVGLAVAWINPFLSEAPGPLRVGKAALGAAAGAGLLWSIGWIWTRLRGVEAMGLGDVKLMGMVGALSGLEGVFFTLLAGSVAGAAVGLALIPLRGRSLRDTLPFGCFLAPSALVALVFARRAVEAYLAFAIPGP